MALDLRRVEQRAKIGVATEVWLHHCLLVQLLGGPGQLLERVAVHGVLSDLRVVNAILVSRFLLVGSKDIGQLLLRLKLEVLLSVLIFCQLAFLCHRPVTVTELLLRQREQLLLIAAAHFCIPAGLKRLSGAFMMC